MSNTPINFKYVLTVAAVVVFTWFVHELGHWLTYTAMGYEAWMSFNKVSVPKEVTLTDLQKMWGSAAGPLITVLQGLIAYMFLSRKAWNTYVYPFLFVAFYMRTLAGLMNIIQLNDEGRISQFLELGTFTLPILVSAGLFFMVYKISQKYQIRKKFHLITTLLTMLFSSLVILSDQFFRLRIL